MSICPKLREKTETGRPSESLRVFQAKLFEGRHAGRLGTQVRKGTGIELAYFIRLGTI